MSESQSPEARPTEVRATAHVMQLDPGLYCIAHTPGTAAADAVTGLPGVRISPGPGAFAGQLTLCGFSPDGWLGRGDDAVMLRIAGAPAQVMVTIYQSPNPTVPAPQLQVIALSSRPAPVAPAPAPEVLAHVNGLGDLGGKVGDWIGERGSRRWIEGFALAPPGVEVEYQAVLGRDWMSPWSETGQFCGSRFMSLPILGLCVRLRGAAAESHAVALSATFVDGSVAGPVGAGEACCAESLAALEAFRLEITARTKPGRRRR